MTPVVPLKTASVLSLLFAAGHLAGGLKSWSPAGRTVVLNQMESFRFAAGGVMRSYLDFYIGFGLIIGLYLLLQAVVLWQLAAAAKSGRMAIAPIVASFLVVAAAGTYVCARYIFVLPAVFSAAIAACLAMAFFACIRVRSAE